MSKVQASRIAKRFSRHLPVVVDVETGGVNPQTDALLEVAIVFVDYNEANELVRTHTLHEHVKAFEGAHIDEVALQINQIDPYHPFRFAKSEEDALSSLLPKVKEEVRRQGCQRAYLVGHNSWFDLLFLRSAMRRVGVHDKDNPFHRFTTIDTATLSTMAFGQSVLARAIKAAGIPFDTSEAHSAIYDAEKTADLFCHIINHYKPLRRSVIKPS